MKFVCINEVPFHTSTFYARRPFLKADKDIFRAKGSAKDTVHMDQARIWKEEVIRYFKMLSDWKVGRKC
jgi:hypothetical protein